MQKLISLIKYCCFCCLCLWLNACYYDKEEEIYPNLGCQTENVSYANTILPILEDNCYSCHRASANFGGITLEGYDRLQTYINNGQLLGAIKHQAGFSPMPQNQPQLAACNIEKIETWINDGAPDN